MFGCAWRLSHHAGSGSAQPFIAGTTRFGPSAMKPTIATRVFPDWRPTEVSRSIPHCVSVDGRRPSRPPVIE